MKKFWKILGLGALVAGLTPYKVEKNEETGESSYQALLWRGTSRVDESGEKQIGIDLGEGTLTSKIKEAVGKKDEAHLFSDELSVEYTAPAAAEIKEKTAEVVEEAVEAAEETAETVKETAAETAEEIAEAAEEAAETVKETAAETAEEIAEAAEEAVEAAEEAVEEIAEPEETQEPQAE